MSIALDNVTKRFGRTTAVSDLTLEVTPGEAAACLPSPAIAICSAR